VNAKQGRGDKKDFTSQVSYAQKQSTRCGERGATTFPEHRDSITEKNERGGRKGKDFRNLGEGMGRRREARAGSESKKLPEETGEKERPPVESDYSRWRDYGGECRNYRHILKSKGGV